MRKETSFFIYLIERYARYKGTSADQILKEWDALDLTDFIYDMYEIYHAERLQNAFDDIDALICEKTAERTTEMNTKKNIDCLGSKENRLGAFGLHLELDLKDIDDEDLQLLKKYGSMQESISRDILVPSDFTLHALNYAILRMFGWQNGHPHCFSLPEDVFEKLTGNRFRTWSELAGVYFRFPSEDFEDIYWDDDYREGESIRSWMKKKYTGPYQYNGYHEHYLLSQMEVQNLLARWNEITVHEFDFGAETQPEPYQVKLQDATIHQVSNAFADFMCGELIERLPLAEVILVENAGAVDFGKRKEELEAKLANVDTKRAIKEYQRSRFTSWKREQEFLEAYDTPAFPVTEELIYRYDFGDGWEVRIRCEEVYLQDEAGVWKDGRGEIRDEYADVLDEVVFRHRPVCIGKDGIEMVDDVGGIGGFCNMLRVIHEADMEDDIMWDERNQMLQWLDMMGWTGRRISAKRTL